MVEEVSSKNTEQRKEATTPVEQKKVDASKLVGEVALQEQEMDKTPAGRKILD